MSSLKAVGLVAAIFLSFGLIHSLCVTGFVKGLIRKILGERFVKAFYRLIYTVFSAITTAGAAWLILQIPDTTLWRAPLWLWAVMRAVQAGAFIFGALSFRAISPFEFIGVSQAWRFVAERRVAGDMEGITGKGLVTSGVYGLVRHPLYLAGIIIFTVNPIITRNWLTVQILADIYFIYGAFVEEKRLIERFGDEYRRYMEKVPRFWPRLRKKLV